jgi:hypothetical protein
MRFAHRGTTLITLAITGLGLAASATAGAAWASAAPNAARAANGCTAPK